MTWNCVPLILRRMARPRTFPVLSNCGSHLFRSPIIQSRPEPDVIVRVRKLLKVPVEMLGDTYVPLNLTPCSRSIISVWTLPLPLMPYTSHCTIYTCRVVMGGILFPVIPVQYPSYAVSPRDTSLALRSHSSCATSPLCGWHDTFCFLRLCLPVCLLYPLTSSCFQLLFPVLAPLFLCRSRSLPSR